MNLILDGFDHYGTGTPGQTNMLAGIYAGMSTLIKPEAVNPRTGAGCVRSTGTATSFWRRAIPEARAKVFMSLAQYLDNLPSSNGRYCVGQMRTAGNVEIVSFTLTTVGQIEIRIGDEGGTVVATSAIGAFQNGVYQAVESMGFVNGVTSSAECRVNGVTVVSVNDIDLGIIEISQVAAGATDSLTHGIGNFYHDDLRVGDDTGGVNDDFMGDRRVFTDFPDEDGTPQEFTPLSGTDAWAMVDEASPDGDTSYIEGTAPGQVSRLRFPDLSANVASVSGIAFSTYARKSDVGDATIRVNVLSESGEELGTEQVLDETYSYLPLQLYDQDPDIAGPWTPAAVNASVAEIERTA